MSQVTELTGATPPSLRYWEKQFKQLRPRKDNHGNRYYTPQDVALIRRILFIRDEMKITRIDAIRNELASNQRKTDVRTDIAAQLNIVRDKLVELRNLL